MTTGQVLYELTDKVTFLRKVREAMNVRAHYMPCINCDGLGEIMTEHDCRGMGYAPGGCPICDGHGFTSKECPVCHGDKEIVVTEDEGLEVYR